MPSEGNICIFENLGLGEAAKRGVGTGANQLPDMSSFNSVQGSQGYCDLPNGWIIQVHPQDLSSFVVGAAYALTTGGGALPITSGIPITWIALGY